ALMGAGGHRTLPYTYCPLLLIGKQHRQRPVRRPQELVRSWRLVDRYANRCQRADVNLPFGVQAQESCDELRVALAYAHVKEPEVFLFDEPLSNLDAALWTRARIEIKKLHQQVQATSIFVTHDQEEAMMLSDLIAVMQRGKVVQPGPPVEI